MSTSEAIALAFPANVYPLDVVKKAAYRFSAAFSFEFALDEDSIAVRLFPIAEMSEQDRTDFVHRFRTEVLDQDLRATIASETEAVRNAVLAYAFSRTGLQNEQVQDS